MSKSIPARNWLERPNEMARLQSLDQRAFLRTRQDAELPGAYKRQGKGG